MTKKYTQLAEKERLNASNKKYRFFPELLHFGIAFIFKLG